MTDPRFIYLETQIATATPQKLRLLLIEGAIRQAQLALEHWEQGRHEDGLAAVIRCRSIAAELIDGVRDDGSALTRQVIGIYAFIFKALTEAQLQRDITKLADVLTVLHEERQTWQQVCQTLTDAPQPAHRLPSEAEEILAPRSVDSASLSAGYLAPHLPNIGTSASSGFSLEV
jgi:flagellar secretion chaperone FliS